MTTEYLYGIQAKILENMLYFDALEFKLKSGQALYMYLNNKSKVYGDKIHVRKFFVEKAIKHTRKLLAERN